MADGGSQPPGRYPDPKEEIDRLTRALEDAIGRQAATTEILQVISQSPSDAGPVFDTIVRNALSLCRSQVSWIWLLEGDRLTIVAPHNVPADFPAELSVVDAPNAARAIREGTVLNIADTEPTCA
jgi:hypothetical protein